MPRPTSFLTSLVACMLCFVLDVGASAQAADYRIELQTSEEGITAEYQLRAAVEAFRFNPTADAIRAQSWRVTTSGLMLDAGVVRSASGARFDRFTLLITPDQRAIDRVYPALQRIGESGYLLHTPHLRADTDEVPIIRAARAAGHVTIAAGKLDPQRLPADRYIYLGPKDYLSERASMSVVSPPRIPAWVRQLSVDTFERVAGEYAQRLAVRLPVKPLLVLSYDETQPGASWRGETTPGYTLSLRYTGRQWQTQTAASSSIVETFVGHEAFHFWNAELLSSTVNATQPWLHEGSADYAALLTAPSLEGKGFTAELEQRLNRCQSSLQERALNGPAGTQGSAPYSCGTVLFWAADVATRTGTRGAGFFELWRELFARARGQGNAYEVLDLLAVMAKQSSRAQSTFELLLNDGDASRWMQLVQRLRALGIAIDRDVSEPALREQLLQHLLALNCPGSRRRGFFTRADSLELDSDPVCAALPSGQHITTINGYNVLTQIRSAFDTASRQCALGQSVALGGGTFAASVPCTQPLREPIPGFRVRSAEPAAQP